MPTIAEVRESVVEQIKIAVSYCLTLDEIKNKLGRRNENKDAKNIDSLLGSYSNEVVSVENLRVAVIRENLFWLDKIAVASGQSVREAMNLIWGSHGNTLIRNIFAQKWNAVDGLANALGWSRASVICSVVGRIIAIEEITGLPINEWQKKLLNVKGDAVISDFFGVNANLEDLEPVDLGPSINNIEMAKRPDLRPYQIESIRKIEEELGMRRAIMYILALPTGAGKTTVANELVDRFLRKNRNAKVLWLAPNWRLLKQAVVALYKYFPWHDAVRRIGGPNQDISDLPDYDIKDGRIFYTTLHTWFNRQDVVSPSLVIYDECHWGISGPMLASLYEKYLGSVPVLGLSATPRKDNRARVIFQKSYAELMEQGYLARPIVHDVHTGIEWNPAVRMNQFTGTSLSELGGIRKRNDFIVNVLIEGRRKNKYKRVLIFACSIDHAKELFELLRKRNIDAAMVHSAIEGHSVESVIKDFREGKITVLVNVEMLTHGIDVPEIDTIFMTRPTESAVLCSQMVGRGARRIPTKDEFEIVEFTDNLLKHQELVFHANGLFPPVETNFPAPSNGNVRRHSVPTIYYFKQLINIPELKRLTYLLDQTFGVEIEIALADGSMPAFESEKWQKIAKNLIQTLQSRAGVEFYDEPYGWGDCEGEKDYQYWKVQYDGSVGFEIVSPILKNQEGFEELKKVCEALEGLGERFIVNHKAGLHVHFSTLLKTDAQLHGFLKRVQRLEPGLFTLVAPSRLYGFDGDVYDFEQPNVYCEPIRCVGKVDDVGFKEFRGEYNSRYYSLNFTLWDNSPIGRMEVRMHSGTVEYTKIIPWICLWMYIFNSSCYSWKGDGFSGKVFPGDDVNISLDQAKREDIIYLLQQDNIEIPTAMKKWIIERRRDLKPYWEAALPERVASWEAAGWYAAK